MHGKPRQRRKERKEKVTKKKGTTKCSNRNVTAGQETKIPNEIQEKGSRLGGAVCRTEIKWKTAKTHKKTQKKEFTEGQKKVKCCGS
jgi:hypothetical protein